MKVEVTAAACLLAFSAFADDEPQITEQNGSWVAVSYVDGTVTDVCVASSLGGKLGFRSDKETVEIRSANPEWSLGTNTTGTMTITAGKYSQDFAMNALNGTTLTTVVPASDLIPLLDAFDTASSASITFGKKTKDIVSLSGSTKILNTWRTCTGANGFGDVGQPAGTKNTPF